MVGLETHYKWVPGMGKSSINGELSIAMFDYQPFVSHFLCVGDSTLAVTRGFVKNYERL